MKTALYVPHLKLRNLESAWPTPEASTPLHEKLPLLLSYLDSATDPNPPHPERNKPAAMMRRSLYALLRIMSRTVLTIRSMSLRHDTSPA